jgi:predicted aldo/keto reductase-like oxidoreductase
MDRRSFLKMFGGTAAAVLGGNADAVREMLETSLTGEEKPMPKRLLGKTGEKLSIIGYGGLALSRVEQAAANDSVAMAVDRGVNYFDVAPAYGKAEDSMGVALNGKRKKVFLSCKTARRDKSGAQAELERSLKRLKTDHFDLYQLHHIRSTEETEQAVGPNGAMESFVAAKKKGQVRFLGFTAHTMKAALLAMEKFPFDTVMFPVNFMECMKTGFGPPVIKKATEKGMGIIAIKSMYRGLWPEGVEKTGRIRWYRPVSDPAEIDMALRFTLSQPSVATAVTPSDVDLIRLAVTIGPNYRPLSESEQGKLRDLSKDLISHFKIEEERVAYYRECGERLIRV